MPWRPAQVRKENVLRSSDCSAEHRSDKQRWREHASRSSAGKRQQGRNDLQSRQNREHLPCELAVHGLVNVFVARAHHLRRAKDRYKANQQAGQCGLKILRPLRHCLEAGTQIGNTS